MAKLHYRDMKGYPRSKIAMLDGNPVGHIIYDCINKQYRPSVALCKTLGLMEEIAHFRNIEVEDLINDIVGAAQGKTIIAGGIS